MTSLREHLGEDVPQPEREPEQEGPYSSEPEPERERPAQPPKRKHRASYARDNKKGGYNIRVVGPNAVKFAGREVPVNTKAGGEHTEKLLRLIWSGTDRDSGLPAALYTFEQKPAETDEVAF